MDFEAKLLTELGIVEIIEKPHLKQPPSEDDLAIFNTQFNRQLTELKQIEDAKNMHRFLTYIDNVVAGHSKTKKRRGQTGENTSNETEDQLRERLISEQRVKISMTPMTNRLIEIPYAHYRPSCDETLVTIDVDNAFKFKVFSDLWRRKYTMTLGDTFGGDFLCYPGDPLHYHASHIVICCQNGQVDFDDVLKFGRSSVIVNKNCVFAYEGSDQEVKYQTMEWISTIKIDEEVEPNKSTATVKES